MNHPESKWWLPVPLHIWQQLSVGPRPHSVPKPTAPATTTQTCTDTCTTVPDRLALTYKEGSASASWHIKPTTHSFLYPFSSSQGRIGQHGLNKLTFYRHSIVKHIHIHKPNLLFVCRIRKLHLVSWDLMAPPKLPRNAPITAKQTEVHCWWPTLWNKSSFIIRVVSFQHKSHQLGRYTQPLFLLTPPFKYNYFIQVKGRTDYLMLDSQFFHVLV